LSFELSIRIPVRRHDSRRHSNQTAAQHAVLNGTVRLIDRHVGKCRSACIGIGDRNTAERAVCGDGV
jgi:hypothetical protein